MPELFLDTYPLALDCLIIMIDGGNLIGVDFLFVCFRHDHLLWLME